MARIDKGLRQRDALPSREDKVVADALSQTKKEMDSEWSRIKRWGFSREP